MPTSSPLLVHCYPRLQPLQNELSCSKSARASILSIAAPQVAIPATTSLVTSASTNARAIAIGNFDGVHIGHQAMLQSLQELARAHTATPTVLSFYPHPRQFFATRHPARHDVSHNDISHVQAPAQILTLRDKLQVLQQAGAQQIALAHFNQAFSQCSPAAFVETVLHQTLRARVVLVGEDFRFGAKRAGDFAALKALGAHHGMQVEAMPTVLFEGARVSSSRVRSALAAGDFTLAQALLGRPYCISGHVLHGKKLGRTLGFPTLNISVPSAPATLAVGGIFAVRIRGLSAGACAALALEGVASLGARPTVDSSGRMLLEVHVFNYSDNAYGKVVQVEFVQKIRDEEKYNDLMTLQAAIASDAQQARALLSKAHPS